MVVDANTLTNLLVEKRNDFNKKMTAVNTLISAMKVDMKAMDKLQDKMTRELLKKNKSFPELFSSAYQFYKAYYDSTDLATFWDWIPGDFSRGCVQDAVHTSRQAQDPTERHHSQLDPLRTLLDVKGTDDLTYFNLDLSCTHFRVQEQPCCSCSCRCSNTTLSVLIIRSLEPSFVNFKSYTNSKKTKFETILSNAVTLTKYRRPG
jgi:hypothetical protein